MTKYDWAEPNAPAHQASQTGCKVRWRYYDKREDADLAAEAAAHDREIQLRLGYDFGYCWPGSISWVGPDHSCGGDTGRWEVCFP